MSERMVVEPRSVIVERRDLPAIFSGFFRVTYFAGAVLGLLSKGTNDMTIGAVAYYGPWIAWPIAIASLVMSLSSRVTRAMLVLDARGDTTIIEDGDRKSLPRKDIAGALFVMRNDEPTVEIEIDGGDRYILVLDDAVEARALVDRLGFGPKGARVRSRLATPSRRIVHLPIALVAWIAGIYVGSGLYDRVGMPGGTSYAFYNAGVTPLVTIVLYEVLRWLMRPPEIVVGDEGAVMRSFPRRVLQGAAAQRALSRLRGIALDRARAKALGSLAADRHAETATTAAATAAFTRNGRTLDDWRADLRAKMDRGGYREAATPADTAASVLRDARASAEQRAGAAVALRIAGEPVERIRVAADATTDTRLRAALEAIADGDDDAIIERRVRRLGA